MTEAVVVARSSSRIASRVWLGRAYLAALALTTLSYGSATRLQGSLAALTFALVSVATLAEPIASRRVRGVRTLALALVTTLAAFAFFQTLPLAADSPYAHSAWRAYDDLFGDSRAFISVAPGATREALPSLFLPFLVFVSGLALFQGDDGATDLWQALGYFGAGYAVYGVTQEVFFPEQLLFETKQYYVGSLTATFVNRNTAGTFFGVALVLNFALIFRELKEIRVTTLIQKATHFDIEWPSPYARVVVQSLACVACGVALFLTQSRGAVGATFVGVAAAAVLFASRPMTRDKPNPLFVRWRRLASVTAALAIVIGAFSLFAGRSTYRMQEAGAEDSRWCAFGSISEAIRDNWRFGTGFGAFQDTFPMYRHADCAGIFGVWERAHNVYLEALLGFGILFVFVGGLGAVALIWTLVRGLRLRHRMRFAPVGGLAALVLVALHSVVDFSLQIPGFNVYFAAVMAAAVTASLGR